MKLKSSVPTPSNRQPEKWFRRLMWVVSLIFAGFLIGLGGKIVADLPFVKPNETTIADYVTDRVAYDRLQNDLQQAETQKAQSDQEYDKVALDLSQQRSETQNQEASFNNWLATRSVTEQSEQNPEVLKRTKALDVLKAKEANIEQNLNKIEQTQLATAQKIHNIQNQINDMEQHAQQFKDRADNRTELTVFSYRLLITLPLLALAWYLFARHRHGSLWPFVWGFVFFALFVFFVELVPYLPSYGGYVRYAVGILLTFFGGRYAMLAMNRYLQRKKQEEETSRTERQSQLNYDQAQAKLSKSICPSCERLLDLQNPDLDFCPHCGIHLFHYCGVCSTRKSAFNYYCCKCGTKSEETQQST